MIYLLTLGWPWLAAALALGALIGFLAFTRGRDATFSGGWIIVLGVVLLAAGIAVSYAELLDGRDAAAFDIALALGLAYAVGLPLGGWVRTLDGGEVGRRRPELAPVIVTPARIAAPEPIVVPEPPPVAPRAGKAPPGVKPETLAAPRNGAPDDLARIKGVGPKSLKKLHALGVFHYDQIAAWNLDNARWIGAAIGAPGRVERDKWIQQARALAGAGAERK
jgi:predicted flap endonuclease-1-like 5' DNA nuclease